MVAGPSETSRAVATCIEIAASYGIDASEARVLRDVTNVVVHLAPAPVIARVSTTLGPVRGAQSLDNELRFAAHALRSGAPVVPPTDVLPAGPHSRDGFLVSFWRLVDHDPGRALDQAAVGRALRALHDAMTDLTVDLPAFDRLDEVEALLEGMTPGEIGSPPELGSIRRALPVARGRLSQSSLVSRPIHGDAHFGNILRTVEGPLWADLENVCAGPVEYDLACLVWRERVHGHPAAGAALASYGPYDPDLIEALLPALGVFLTVWAIVIARRRPSPVVEAYVDERLRYVRDLT